MEFKVERVEPPSPCFVLYTRDEPGHAFVLRGLGSLEEILGLVGDLLEKHLAEGA